MQRLLKMFLMLSIVLMLVQGGFALLASPNQGPGDATTKTAHVGDIDIAYKTIGKGYPLLLIMGYSGTMDLWAPRVLRELSPHYKVILFDNRGMGKTTASSKEFTIELFAEDARGLLDALGMERAHVLGWSLGTYIAQELALGYPHRVRKLILYEGDCGGKEAIYPAPEILRLLSDTSGSPDERGETLLSTLFPPEWLEKHPDPRTYFPMITETSSQESIKRQYQAWEDWEGTYERLSNTTQPTLLITGANDVNTPWQNSLILVELIPGAWLVQLENGGHGVMYQYPEKFSRIVLTFLED